MGQLAKEKRQNNTKLLGLKINYFVVSGTGFWLSFRIYLLDLSEDSLVFDCGKKRFKRRSMQLACAQFFTISPILMETLQETNQPGKI